MTSPYLEAPTRSLAEVRRGLADERWRLLIAWACGRITEAQCDAAITPIERQLEMIERAEGRL